MLFSDGPIKAVELVPDSCRTSGTENGNWTRTDVTEDSLKKLERRPFLILLVKFGSFGPFDFTRETQYTYIVNKNTIYLHFLCNRTKSLSKTRFFTCL